MRRWERVGMEVGRRGEWCVCVCVKRDDIGGVNTGRSKWSTQPRVTPMETQTVHS